MRIALLSNISAEFLAAKLKKQHSVWISSGFDQWVQECLSPSLALWDFRPELVFLLLDGRSMVEKWSAVDHFTEAIKSLANHFDSIPIWVSNIDIMPFRIQPLLAQDPSRGMELEWQNRLQEIQSVRKNVACFDLKRLVCMLGSNAFYDYRMRYAGDFPYSILGLNQIEDQFECMLAAYQGCRKKAIAIDLDNTLWKGTISEDGVDGIKLWPDKEGRPFSDFQQRLKELQGMGILLVCLSKNNAADIEPIWRDRRMLLKKEDFVAIEANWSSKPENLVHVAGQLNLGLDAFVFLDDNPAERAQMRKTLPQVVVPEFPGDEAQLEPFIIDVARTNFPALSLTAEDLVKTSQYHAESLRSKWASARTALPDYLNELEIWVDIHQSQDEEVPRLAQLSQKTNQFNLTTHRYTPADIRGFMHDGHRKIYSVFAGDKFGPQGLISFVHLRVDGIVAEIIDFVMSCRAMNRTIEFALFDFIMAALVELGVKRVNASYRETAKNAPVKKLYEALGFDVDDAGKDVVLYSIDAGKYSSHKHFVKMV